jgi:hypothetical protein
MIYFLAHRAPTDYARLKLRKGTPMCKVVADSLDELMNWGRRHGLGRIHLSRNGRPHYDLWGPYLMLCPDRSEMRRYRRLYRTRVLKKPSFPSR